MGDSDFFDRIPEAVEGMLLYQGCVKEIVHGLRESHSHEVATN